jgi:hypothetical protein
LLVPRRFYTKARARSVREIVTIGIWRQGIDYV